MDTLIRIFSFSAIGLVLLVANLWFARTAYRQFLSTEYVISPFNVIDPQDSIPDGAGLAMAQMMAARLVNIQAQLEGAREAPMSALSDTSDPDSELLGATSLFITRPVDIPTDLFEPVEIRATVGGVEVGGIFSYFQHRLAAERAISFTTHHREGNAIVSADFGAFAPNYGALWTETSKDPGEIATFAAYALLHAHLSENRESRIRQLDLADFRRLIESVVGIDRANRKALQGYVVDRELATHLQSLEKQLQVTPKWPELIYMVASTAEGLGNTGKAIVHFRRLNALSEGDRKGAIPKIFTIAESRLAALGATTAAVSAEAEARFVEAAAKFAQRMNLPGPDPKIAFVPNQHAQVQAVWKDEERRYEVNPPFIETPGLPQYIALMGRFFDRNFKRCFSENGPQPDMQFWNQFRYAVVDYLIQSNPEFSKVANIGSTFPLFAALKAIEGKSNKEATQRLGLVLLERFECDWTNDRLEGEMLAINADLDLMTDTAIKGGMAAAGLIKAPNDAG